MDIRHWINIVEGEVIRFPKRHRDDPLNMVHRAATGHDLPPEDSEPTYGHGVSVRRIPDGWAVFHNGAQIGDAFDDPERAHEEAAHIESAVADESDSVV
jgi:hypothetical protein